jgi:hypothetical protein
VTDLITLIGAITAMVTAFIGLGVILLQLRGIHRVVNQRFTDQGARTQQLIDSLKAAGVKVPKDQADLPAGYRKPDPGGK